MSQRQVLITVKKTTTDYSQRPLLITATHWKLPAWRVEKEQETSQGGAGDKLGRCRRQVREVQEETSQGEGAGDKSGRRSRRQVREKEQETSQGEGGGDKSER